MKRWWLVGTLAGVAVLAWAASRFLPWLVVQGLPAVVSRVCADCSLAHRDVDVDWVTGTVRMKEVDFGVGKGTSLEVAAHIAEVSVDPDWFGLVEGRLTLDSIHVVSPSVRLSERDSPPEGEQGGNREEAGEGAGWRLVIRQLSVSGGEFTYQNLDSNRLATLELQGIELKAENLHGAPAEGVMKGSASGVLESSGTFELSVSTEPYQELPHAVVVLRVRNQELDPVNDFFIPDSGVELKGELTAGDARVEMQGDRLHSWATVDYEGLDIGLKATNERGTLEATLGELFAGITFASSSRRGDRDTASGEASVERKPDQSIVSFILTGMKDAALKAATKPPGISN